MFKILDCTLRDGGYYNKWDFKPQVVEAYLKAMAESKIDYVELGLRNFTKPGFFGPFAYTTEDYINRLKLPDGPTYGVMVDAKTILTSELSIVDAVNALFVPASESKINLVRIAAHFHEVENSGDIVKTLKDMGYTVGFNLMQSGGKPCEVIAEKAKAATDWGCLDVLYFADSLGNMDIHEVERIVKALRIEWDGELGIHTHNNMANALVNCLAAKEFGVKWIDVTVTGMGRGAGNAQTESILATIAQNSKQYPPNPVYEIVLKYFEPMQKRFGWGSNLMYFLGAQHNVHPTYIQNLLSDSHYGTEEIIGAIEYLRRLETSSAYSHEHYKRALSSSDSKEVSGSSELAGTAKGREVLILANGPSLERYLSDIEAYIRARKPIVIVINANEKIDSKLVDYYCISHNTKFLAEKEKYKYLTKPLLLPKHRFTEQELEILTSQKLSDYGVTVTANAFEIFPENCIVPYDVTAAYAFAIAYNFGAKRISLVGFDGYDSTDERQNEMIQIINLFKQKLEDCNFQSLTPTSYPLDNGSIYAPNS